MDCATVASDGALSGRRAAIFGCRARLGRSRALQATRLVRVALKALGVYVNKRRLLCFIPTQEYVDAGPAFMDNRRMCCHESVVRIPICGI